MVSREQFLGKTVNFKTVKPWTLLLSLIAVSSTPYAAEQDLTGILLNIRTKPLNVKLDKDQYIKYWFDSYNGLALKEIKEYDEFFNGINEPLDRYFKFIHIRGDTFDMGSSPEEVGHKKNENQIYDISVSDFYMQTTQVTQFQYWLVTKTNPSQFKKITDCPSEHVIFDKISICPNHPVENVSWDDVQLFLNSLNNKSKHNAYALPSEAQWEYAARAKTETRFSFGNSEKNLVDYAWFSENGSRRTHQVASLKPNAFGLFDSTGNVYEWVQDSWSCSSMRFEESQDPIFEDDTSNFKVTRGGGWSNKPSCLRTAVRLPISSKRGYNNLGFRMVRTK